jgi:hypothetical protein
MPWSRASVGVHGVHQVNRVGRHHIGKPLQSYRVHLVIEKLLLRLELRIRSLRCRSAGEEFHATEKADRSSNSGSSKGQRAAGDKQTGSASRG